MGVCEVTPGFQVKRTAPEGQPGRAILFLTTLREDTGYLKVKAKMFQGHS
jgi:hypothetical protein